MRLNVTRTLISLVLILLPLFVSAQDQTHTGTKDAEEPGIVYGLVVDRSGSLRAWINRVITAAKRVVKSNTPNDQAFIVTFVDREKIDVAQDLTRDQAALVRALDSVYVESGTTAIFDALYFSAKQVAELRKDNPQDTRRPLVLITDGEDRGSYYTIDQILPILRENKIQVFVLGLTKEVSKPLERRIYQSSITFLNRIAEETGGRAIFVPKDKDWDPYVDELITAMRAR